MRLKDLRFVSFFVLIGLQRPYRGRGRPLATSSASSISLGRSTGQSRL